MQHSRPFIVLAASVLLGACSSESSDSESNAPSDGPGPGPAMPPAAPGPSGTPGPAAAPSGLQFAPLKGTAQTAVASAQAEADAALGAACACSGVGTSGPCATGTFDWSGVQLSECYYAAFDANPGAVDNVAACLRQSLTMIQQQYAAQDNCGEQGLTFAQLQIASALQSCALVEPALQSALTECDGAPSGL